MSDPIADLGQDAHSLVEIDALIVADLDTTYSRLTSALMRGGYDIDDGTPLGSRHRYAGDGFDFGRERTAWRGALVGDARFHAAPDGRTLVSLRLGMAPGGYPAFGDRARNRRTLRRLLATLGAD